MVFEIRTAGPEDAVGIARVWAAAMPQLVKTARGVEAELKIARSRIVLIAVDGEDVVGYGNVHLPAPDETAPRVRIAVQVPPAVRSRGIGGALADAVIAEASNAGAARLLVVVGDDDESKGFATRRGFTISRRMSHSQADLTTGPTALPAPHGLRMVDYGELEPRQLWLAEEAVRHDDPSGLSTGPQYDEWVPAIWHNPDLRHDLSIAVLDGDQVVSFASTTADPDRGVIWSNLTGTIPAYRGRGLAKVAKSVALTRAREAGFSTAYTGNDAANAPMLAVNEWLGYRASSTVWAAEKTL